MAHARGGSSSTLSRANWKLEMLVFEEEGKTGVPVGNPLGARMRTNNKRPQLGPHWWEASALTIAPSLLSQFTCPKLIV